MASIDRFETAASVRARALRDAHYEAIALRIDRAFVLLLLGQWLFAVALALVVTPKAWDGLSHHTHPHVWFAIGLGGLLALPPAALMWARPGTLVARYAIVIAQMAFGALLIHLTGGRIESHFHVFGSLAFIAFYRDVRLLLVATAVVLLDHVGRGGFWPESVYGVVAVEPFRWLEHVAWVTFEDVFLIAAIRNEKRIVSRTQYALEELSDTLESRVILRTGELTRSREQYRSLIETTNAVPWEMVPDALRFGYVGPQASGLLDYPPDEWLTDGFLERVLDPEERDETLAILERLGASTTHAEVPLKLLSMRRRPVWLRALISVVRDSEGRAVRRGFLLDVTAQRLLEAELRSAQKLETVGRLASGVAHEINTPIQFVSDSVDFLTDATATLGKLLRTFRGLLAAPAERLPDLLADARAADEAADTDYLLENVPGALATSTEGLMRIATIVRALNDFSNPHASDKSEVDLNSCVRTTLAMTANEYRDVADIVTDLGDLPPVMCHPGEINQVLLNLVVNAAHAVADVVRGTETRGKIKVRTWLEGDSVCVCVRDSGGGIPSKIEHRVFDPFFTTKDVGRGSGQGLTIARSIVVDKHGGELSFETEVGRGTAFVVRLPIETQVPLAMAV